ncbi:MAG: hypothetical protein Q9169_002637 [Polycauliona sp. 2 TL-2023]
MVCSGVSKDFSDGTNGRCGPLSPLPSAVSFPSGSSQKSQKSARHAFNPIDDPRPIPFKFLKTHHLVITTAQGVYTCGSHGITEIFRSGSKGIVAAKRASTGSGILAVADDHLVVLHDVRKGMQSSYRLRSADDRVRMLRYAKDSNRLFFTTALQDAVQTYDLRGAALLKPAYEHPTPPNAFAVSSTSHLLLSVSESPSVIQLTNLLLGTRPLLLRPQCSSAPVVVVEFHPERGNLFLLAFADGTCAVYDAAFIFRNGGTGERRSGESASEVRWEVSHIKGLHAPLQGTSTTKETHSTKVTAPALTHDRVVGITAAAFIPGYRTMVITAGSDGKCCLLDFAASEASKPSLLRSWSVAVHVTCLALLAPSPGDGASLPIAGLRGFETHDPICYVAIGCRDSKIFIFDLYGNLLWDQTMFQGGSAILNIEWMDGDDWPQPVALRPVHLDTHQSTRDGRRKSPGSVLAGGRTSTEEIVAVLDDDDIANETPKGIGQTGQCNEVGTHTPAINHMDLPSLMESIHSPKVRREDSSTITGTTSTESLGTMMRSFQFPLPPIRDVPPVPPLERRDMGQLPRNNSWAAESTPDKQALQKVLDASSIEAYLDTLGGRGVPVPTDNPHKTQAPPKSSPLLVRASSETGPSGNREVDRHDKHTEREPTAASARRPDITQEDLWTDITVDDNGPAEQYHHDEPSEKENNSGKNFTLAPPNDDPVGPTMTKTSKRPARPLKSPSNDFTIFIDKRDPKTHPQPLTANPSKPTKRQPLVPTNTNTLRVSPTVRAPWYRQPKRNINHRNHAISSSSGENHRSSIYGPGALSRKIQQEVMITVSVELDVLRREMNERFAFQKAEFEFEIKKSQVWTLRVEDENRMLREEMARERRRKRSREGEKGRGRERLNLC